MWPVARHFCGSWLGLTLSLAALWAAHVNDDFPVRSCLLFLSWVMAFRLGRATSRHAALEQSAAVQRIDRLGALLALILILVGSVAYCVAGIPDSIELSALPAARSVGVAVTKGCVALFVWGSVFFVGYDTEARKL